MGHFNRISLQISTMCLVYPCILASYIGQGALRLHSNMSSALMHAVTGLTALAGLAVGGHAYDDTLFMSPVTRYVEAANVSVNVVH